MEAETMAESQTVRRRLGRRVLLWSVAVVALLLLSLALVALLDVPPSIDYSGPVAGWPFYGGDQGGTRYSVLTQINRENVRFLEPAWVYRSGDVSHGDLYPSRSSFQATPILFEDRLLFSTPFSRVIALDPESGSELWSYDPQIDLTLRYSEALVSRGVAAWRDAEAPRHALCSGRVFFGTLDARLLALDADTGAPCPDFGTGGEVDLKVGVGRVEVGQYEVTSPPVVVDDVVVVGSGIGDNRRVDVERGTIRGFDARSGELLWAWDPIPRSPDDPGWEEWTEEGARETGAGNAWAPLSADPERGLVFAPTGSAAPDFYGGVRPGSDIYADSVVALRAATGKRLWHFQVVHHDLWDYDVASQPTLANVQREGEEIPAVIQPTKMGFVFLLDRETGEPLYTVEERPVPQSDVPDEETWPTQPFPTHPPPLHPLRLSEDDAWGLTPWDERACRERIAALRNEGIFTPPSLQGSLEYPSMIGGANWGSAALDEARQLLVLNMSRLASWARLIPRESDEVSRVRGEVGSQLGTPYVMVREPVMISGLGIPCTKPPWGTLTAVDLVSGAVRWEVPLGTIRDLAPIPLPIRWGTPTLGGPIITASGLVFIGATLDSTFRAFDIDTGEVLWEDRLPAAATATPMTYRLRPDGKQYVVIAAGGQLVAFALPD
jgi:quinoprotein glucose dehydrogenase